MIVTNPRCFVCECYLSPYGHQSTESSDGEMLPKDASKLKSTKTRSNTNTEDLPYTFAGECICQKIHSMLRSFFIPSNLSDNMFFQLSSSFVVAHCVEKYANTKYPYMCV